jgi:NADH dehydrogenase
MKHKVIIAGAGFAGIQLAKNLDENLFDIILVDRLNHHQFQPLFYQVAASQIEPSSISFPLRYIFRNRKNIQIRLADLIRVDRSSKTISTTIGDFSYDFLVLALGCKTNFYGNKEIERNAFTLKSTYDAITIRNHILQTFEKVVSAREEEKEALLNLVIVGAGPTGVELAGAFAEIRQHILPHDFPKIDFSGFKITLIEGSKHTLNSMSGPSKKASEEFLRKMGVDLVTETVVKNYDGEILVLTSGKEIKTRTVIWAAGVTANTIEGLPVDCITPSNRVRVNRINRVLECGDIYALGDMCCMETTLYPRGHPQVANVAINQAILLAKNLKSVLLHRPTRDYEYKDLGSMATIGRNKAVVDFKSFKVQGYFAWLIWMFLHLMLILSVRNKLIILINWAWSYITKDSSLRLILMPQKPNKLR